MSRAHRRLLRRLNGIRRVERLRNQFGTSGFYIADRAIADLWRRALEAGCTVYMTLPGTDPLRQPGS